MRKTRVRALKAKFVAETGSLPEKLPIQRPPFVINELRRYKRAQVKDIVTIACLSTRGRRNRKKVTVSRRPA